MFEGLGKGKGCRFKGEYFCSNYEFRKAPDRNGADRKVIVFHLVEAEGAASDTHVVDGDETRPAGMSLGELRKRAYAALQAPRGKPGKSALRAQYERSEAVRDYVLARAAGQCECCKEPAPFARKDGSPYLEPHHTTRLSDAGLDHPAHVAGICPTCHRRIHYGLDGEAKNADLAQHVFEKESSASD